MFFLRKYLSLILIVVISIFSISSFFTSSFFPIHDSAQVARVFEMGKALKDGMFPVRWVFNLGYGYGYPIFNFYAPGAYYIGGFFTLVGFDALIATKLMMVIGILLAGVSMYWFAKDLVGKTGAVVASTFYVYAPYHAVDIYVRGAVGEIWAYAFIPLVALGFYKIFNNSKLQLEVQNDVWKWVAIGSLGYAGIILSHNLTAMMVTPFILIATLLYAYIAYRNQQLYTVRYSLYAIFFGVSLSAFYWLPALFEMGYTNVLSQIGGGADFRDHFVCVYQLWESNWGFGGSIPGCIDGFSFKIGKLHILYAFLAFFLTFFWKKQKNTSTLYVRIFFLFFLLSVGFMLEMSRPLWEALSLMAFIQYPWRFLLFASFFASLLAGFFIAEVSNIINNTFRIRLVGFGLTAISVGALLVFNVKLFVPQHAILKSVSEYTDPRFLQWSASRISDEYMPKGFLKPHAPGDVSQKPFAVLRGDAVIQTEERRTNKIVARITSSTDSIVLVNIAYFPFWKVKLDGKQGEVNPINEGIIVQVTEGVRALEMYIEETRIEKAANAVSLISVFVLALGIMYARARKRRTQ